MSPSETMRLLHNLMNTIEIHLDGKTFEQCYPSVTEGIYCAYEFGNDSQLKFYHNQLSVMAEEL